ncbi:hypothetical protein Hanom_Chr01g00084401 [Helianthus anomalus]
MGDTTRTLDALSSRFRTIRLDSERFESVHNVVQNDSGDLSEDHVIQVALINYRHAFNHDFKTRFGVADN